MSTTAAICKKARRINKRQKAGFYDATTRAIQDVAHALRRNAWSLDRERGEETLKLLGLDDEHGIFLGPRDARVVVQRRTNYGMGCR